jgi:hypothetical protein
VIANILLGLINDDALDHVEDLVQAIELTPQRLRAADAALRAAGEPGIRRDGRTIDDLVEVMVKAGLDRERASAPRGGAA